MPDRPVAIGLLTAHELGLLGKGFNRYMPLPADDSFAEILAKFDAHTDEREKLDGASGDDRASLDAVEGPQLKC